MEEKKGYRAVGKYLMVSPKKVRPIANLIRKKSYTEALAELEAIPNKGARMLKKVLMSAAANAEHNLGYDRRRGYDTQKIGCVYLHKRYRRRNS